MKILFIHNIYKPYYRGGAEEVALNLTEGLKSDNHQLAVVALGYANKEEVVDDVKVYRIKPFNVFNYLDINQKPLWLRFLFHIFDLFGDLSAWKILKIAKAEKPDLIFLQGFKGFGYILPQLLSFYGFRCCVRVYDMQYIHPSGLLPKKISWFNQVYIYLVKLMLGKISLIIFPSEYIKNIYLKFDFFQESKIKVIANPLAIGMSKIQKNNRQKKIINFLFLGQTEKYKGLGDLLEAIMSLVGDFKLHIVGEGGGLNEFKRLALNDSRIIFHGRLDRKKILEDIWPNIDLLINPSRVEESFGMVVIESYAQGVPVITSDIGALPELIKEGQTGWLIRPGDVSQLRYKLQQILDGKILLSSLKKNCLNESKKFVIENYLKSLYEFIK